MKSRILLSRLNIYPIIVILTLFKIFFSTTFLFAESFSIKNIEISKKFNMNFQKNEVLDEGFKIAFQDLISNITKSNEQNEFKNLSLSNIKTIIDSFSIKEEKFINNIYYVNLDVSFNKKKNFYTFRAKKYFSITSKKKECFIYTINN